MEAAIQVLFYRAEPEMKVFSSRRQAFSDNGIYIPINSENFIEVCMDKYLTMKFLFPIILKHSIWGGNYINTFVAQNLNELELFGRYLLKIYDQFLIQEYAGKADSEYTVEMLCVQSENILMQS